MIDAPLTRAQAAALAHVRARALADHDGARASLAAYVDDVDALLAAAGRARVTLSFHPDRLLADGRTVAQGLVDDGRYRSQFVTGVTNGGRSARRGGDRDRWERGVFGDAYQADDVADDERPKYGALDLMEHADGGAPRFGSCFLRLRPAIAARATYCFGDSHARPTRFGVDGALACVLDAACASAATTGRALGVVADAPSLVARVRAIGAGGRPIGRALDEYVEAQVHGDVVLARDVEAVVVDASFLGDLIEPPLRALAAACGAPLSVRPALVVEPDAIPPDFRGPDLPPLAAFVARAFSSRRGVDAAAIGRAAADLHRRPAAWSSWGAPDEAWQKLKQLWHCAVAFGDVVERDGLR